MTWEQWQKDNENRLIGLARKCAREDWPELYQRILIRTWNAVQRDAAVLQKIESVVKSEILDYWRSCKRWARRFASLSEIKDVSLEEPDSFNWSEFFTLCHSSDNLMAARFARSVVNPDAEQLLTEKKEGGFRWGIVYHVVGHSRREMVAAFSRLQHVPGYEALKAEYLSLEKSANPNVIQERSCHSTSEMFSGS